jgi:phage terminase large subunit-like protein
MNIPLGVAARLKWSAKMTKVTVHKVQHWDGYSAIRMVDPKFASRGKHVRAKPVSSLYEQGRVHHVGSFPTLEDTGDDTNHRQP